VFANINLFRLKKFVSIFEKKNLKPVVSLRVEMAFGVNNVLPI